jgi:predicted transcriptional regulator
MNLLPKEYDFRGVEIPCAYLLQTRIKERIDAIEGEGNTDKTTKARLEELCLLNLALDHHISITVREQEMYAELERNRKKIKEMGLVPEQEEPPSLVPPG